MAQAIAKRFGASVAVLVVVSLVTFVVLHVIPGDAAVLQLGLDASPDKLAALREAMGTDKPLPAQYLSWVGGVICGDWGTSSLYGMPVWDVIAPTVPVTLALAAYATVVAVAVSTALGVAAALRPGSAVDVCARTIVQVASAAPGFLVGIVLMLAFGVALGWLPVSGYVAPSQGVGAWVASLTLPAITLAIGECGPLVRIVRSSTIASLRRDYMLSCEVKGLHRTRALVAYALRGALVGPLAVTGVQLAKLLGGAIVVESVFALPGVGRLLLTAVQGRDVMLLQGIVVFVTAAVVLASLLADVLIAAADPSVRGASGERAR